MLRRLELSVWIKETHFRRSCFQNIKMDLVFSMLTFFIINWIGWGNDDDTIVVSLGLPTEKLCFSPLCAPVSHPDNSKDTNGDLPGKV